MPPIIRLLRPKQWTKNLLVWAAWVFTKGWESPDNTVRVALCFLCLCLLSSCVYVVNDLLDAESDAHHPVKKKRPIASGRVTKGVAVALALVLAGLAGALAVSLDLLAGIGVFMAIQIGYNLGLKRVAIVDVLTIALAFVQRAVLGALVIHVTISPWLLVCTGTLALTLAVAKRRHEFILMQGSGISRSALTGYSRPFLDGFMFMAATLACLAYGVYAIESDTAKHHRTLILTVPVVFFAVMRYLLLVVRDDEGGEPESILFSDGQVVFALLLFAAIAVAAMMGMRVPVLEGAS